MSSSNFGFFDAFFFNKKHRITLRNSVQLFRAGSSLNSLDDLLFRNVQKVSESLS